MQVLVLGGGYAGVTLARRLERTLPESIGIVVVDRDERHLVQHELHRLVRRPGMVDDITVPFDSLFDRARHVRGTVTAIDDEAREVALEDGSTLDYDYLAVCMGSRTSYYGLPGVEAHSIPLKRVADAEAIRKAVLDIANDGGGHVVIGGAGLSGVQVAGEIAALVDGLGARTTVSVELVEQAATVAPGFPDHFSEAVERALVEEGIAVTTGWNVTGASERTVEFDDGSTTADVFVWTGGIRAPAPLGDDRPPVPSTLRTGDRTFVVGDAGRVIDRHGEAVPATAQAAIAEAAVAATNIDRLVDHERNGGAFEPRLDRVDFTPRGWIVSVGTRTVAQVGPVVVRDAAARALKASVGVRYLAGVGAVEAAVGLASDELLGTRRPQP